MTIHEAARMLSAMDNVYILTHRRPDGDTLGSAAGLCVGLRALGKKSYVMPNPEITPRYEPFIAPYTSGDTARLEEAVLVSVDIATPDLLPTVYRSLADHVRLSIDHHPTNTLFGADNCVVPNSASTGEVVYDILLELGVPMTAELALPLYLAVSTDTGCFRYSNTTAHTHRVAAHLMETGIDFAAINREMFENKTRRRIRIEALVFDSMDFLYNGTVAVACITQKMIAETGASEDDIDNMSALPRRIDGVDIGVVIKEQTDGVCKVSMRSSQKYEVNRICALLGGGGHLRAAGCQVPGTGEEAKRAVLEAIRQYLSA